MTIRRTSALLVPLLLVVAGCGLSTGYAPAEVNVHTGAAALIPPAAPPDSIRIVTWNIQYSEAVGRALAEIRRHPQMAAADLVFLQEMETGDVVALADSLGFNYVYSPAAVHPHHGRLFGNAVLSRWPVVGQRSEILPHATPGSGHLRIAVAAEIAVGGGRTLHAVSVHTATVIVDQERRLEQAHAALDSLGIDGGPVIVAGDFNTVTDYERTLLRRVGRAVGLDHLRLPPGPTVANKYKRLPGNELVLDHVFYGGLVAGARGVYRGSMASDHYPVWASFALPAWERE